jgi:hypothetical protein
MRKQRNCFIFHGDAPLSGLPRRGVDRDHDVAEMVASEVFLLTLPQGEGEDVRGFVLLSIVPVELMDLGIGAQQNRELRSGEGEGAEHALCGAPELRRSNSPSCAGLCDDIDSHETMIRAAMDTASASDAEAEFSALKSPLLPSLSPASNASARRSVEPRAFSARACGAVGRAARARACCACPACALARGPRGRRAREGARARRDLGDRRRPVGRAALRRCA